MGRVGAQVVGVPTSLSAVKMLLRYNVIKDGVGRSCEYLLDFYPSYDGQRFFSLANGKH